MARIASSIQAFPRLAARLANATRRPAFWMLADQGIVSIGNFASINLLARHLSPSDYGGMGLILETMLFLNAMQAGLINYPLTVQSASTDRSGLRRSASAGLLFTLLILPVLGAGMTTATLACGMGGVAAAAVAPMLLGQIQEMMRRGLIADRRIAQCIAGDAISYLGQAAGIYLLARSRHLGVVSAFLMIGFTSGAAALLQGMQIGLARVTWRNLVDLATQWWMLGRWMLLSGMTLVITSLGFIWTLKWSHGVEAVATLLAVMMLLKICNPIVSSLTSLIIPAVSRASEGGRNPSAATGPALRYVLLGAVLLLPYFALLASFPGFCLRIVFGSTSPYAQCGWLLRGVAINGSLCAAAMLACAWLAGLGRSRANFIVQAAQSAAVLCIGLPLTAICGLPGLIIGACAGYFVQGATASGLINRLLRHHENHGIIDTPRMAA